MTSEINENVIKDEDLILYLFKKNKIIYLKIIDCNKK